MNEMSFMMASTSSCRTGSDRSAPLLDWLLTIRHELVDHLSKESQEDAVTDVCADRVEDFSQL